MSEQIELHEYESAPYRRALQAGYLALRRLETEMGGAADVESVKRVADQQAAMAFAATPAEDDPRIDPARYPTFSHDDRPR